MQGELRLQLPVYCYEKSYAQEGEYFDESEHKVECWGYCEGCYAPRRGNEEHDDF